MTRLGTRLKPRRCYGLLEHEVIPSFIPATRKGIPTRLVARMRESMARLTPRFSGQSNGARIHRGNTIPAAAGYQLRIANKGAIGKQMVAWQHNLEQKWPHCTSRK